MGLLSSLWMLAALSGPLVVIDAPAADEQQASTLATACQRGLGAGRCEVHSGEQAEDGTSEDHGTVAPEVPDPEGAPFSARHHVQLSWSADGLAATLTFSTSAETREPTTTRAVLFDPEDPPLGRYEALGLIVAAHAVEFARKAAPPPAPKPAPLPELAPCPAQSPPVPPQALLDGLLSIGPGLNQGAARYGVGLRAGLVLTELGSGALLGVAGADVAHRFETPTVTWFSGELGLGLLWPARGSVRLDLRLTGVLQALRVRDETASGSVDVGSQRRLGGRLSALSRMSLSPRWDLLIGVRAGMLAPRVDVQLGGQPSGRQPRESLDFLLGLGGVL